MTSDDLFTAADKHYSAQKEADNSTKVATEPTLKSNVVEFSVSDLALSLKKTLEENFSHIRVRGELSGLKLAASGHLYGDIKDVNANINIVCWRGTLGKLSLKPEDGMDVVITGRVSSYPKSSRYQIIIEKMELAGEGALLKMLEERRKKLTAEGLFAPERKKNLPTIPEVIGVITSPTGAVIRDILHRLKDRFPRHVLLWPVSVQGENASVQITSAIEGFNNLSPNCDIPKPDLLIIARGGGSLEDLMAFNEENVVRAAANSHIPIISAVGHETDTTLIDYAADLRAPTPTGAAELAVPVRLQLYSQIETTKERLGQAINRTFLQLKNILQTYSGKLGDPESLISIKSQNLDILEGRLKSVIKDKIHIQHVTLQHIGAKITDPRHLVVQKRTALDGHTRQLSRAIRQIISDKHIKVTNLFRILETLSPKAVLGRGYTLTYNQNGDLIRDPDTVRPNEAITIEFSQNRKLTAKTE